MSDNGTILGPLTRTWTYPSRCNLLFLADCPTCTIAVQAQKCNTASSITTNLGRSRASRIFYAGLQRRSQKHSSLLSVLEVFTNPPANVPKDTRSLAQPKAQQKAISSSNTKPMKMSSSEAVVHLATNVPNMEAHKRVRVSIQQLAGSEPFEISSTSDSESVFLTSSTTNLSSTSAETSTSSVEPDSRGGLSTGAQAGIGVGVGVVGFGILGAAFYLWRRRRRSKVPSKSMLESSQLDSREVKPPGELGGTPLAPSQYAAAELDGTPVRQELP
ncbi:hypothetical protein FG05_35075 [Fusarium graminearum]|nr:hypothetical protein FG05_35075 [Fusarium graminearum]